MSKTGSILTDIAQQGYSIEQLKEACRRALSPYFNNKDILSKYWTCGELLSAFEYVIRYYYDTTFREGLSDVLSLYRSAMKEDKEATIGIILSTLFEFSQKENIMFIKKKSFEKIENDDLFELTIQRMQLIGEVLELGTKHLVYEILALARIIEGVSVDYTKIKDLEFGLAISNILDKKILTSLLLTEPIGLKLSDWRNIAYHHNYRIANNKIECFYGKQNKSFEIDQKQLEIYTHEIIRSSNVFNIARCIFIYDNIELLSDLEAHHSRKHDIYFRDELLNRSLELSLLSQLFLLENVDVSEQQVTITILDLCINNIEKDADKKRRIHSTQFLYNVWYIYPKPTIRVEYMTLENGICFISYVDGTVCEKICNSSEDLSFLAENFQIELI